MELDLEMEVAADEQVVANSSSTVCLQQIVVPGCSRKLSVDDCIFFGAYRIMFTTEKWISQQSRARIEQ